MLILVDGMPGSGKSAMAQFLARCLAAQGSHVRWWYEEERGHPALIFHDQASLQRVVDDLASGDYRRVIAEALARWRQIATDVAATDVVVILDGCLFGYLAWSLFSLDVPEEEIHAYLGAVEGILGTLAPRLVYVYPRDIAQAVARICHRRGDWGERFIRNSTENPYARRHGLKGLAGAVAYWTDYQRFMDIAFAESSFAKLAIAIDEGDWPEYERQALRFLDHPPAENETNNGLDLRPFVGRYRSDDDRGCVVRLDRHQLVLDGLPHVWPNSPLIPLSSLAFEVQSLPIIVTFVEDASGAIDILTVTGPALLEGSVEGVFLRDPNQI